MKGKNIRFFDNRIRSVLLPYVRQPARYIGGEINQVKKDLNRCDVTVALCFPDIYEIGISHTGSAIIYTALNRLEYVAAERVYTPWVDAEQIMRRQAIPLFSLESKAAVADFDIVGFSLTNELCYTNTLNALDLAAIPIRSQQRAENDPLIIAGGQMANCCEPMADFIDAFILGQAEEAVVKLVELYRHHRKNNSSRQELLADAAKRFDFLYVPAFYKFEYEGPKIKSFTALRQDMPVRFESAVVDDLDNAVFPTAPVVPFVEAVHDRISIEIMRGCPGRCRFCQASFCRRPVRYRSIEKIIEIAKQSWQNTGFDTIGLLSLSTADYPDLRGLLERLNDYFRPRHVGLSVPSLRVADQLKVLPALVASVRKSGLTIVVEAASEKLRRIINKPISDDNLLGAVEAAYGAGFGTVKLYFMVGLPEETPEDILGIVELAHRIALLRKKIAGKAATVNVAVSWLVPKPHTPFQWLGQKSRDYFENARAVILSHKRKLNASCLRFRFHDIPASILECAIGRADRRMGAVIERAWQLGARADLWSEHFKYDIWRQAFTENGFELEQIASCAFDLGQILPWQHLGGPARETLLSHYQQAMNPQIQ